MTGLGTLWDQLTDGRARHIGQVLALVFGPLLLTLAGSRRPRGGEGPPVVAAQPTPDFAAYLDRLLTATERLGAATGRLARLEEAVDRVESRLDRIDRVAADTNQQAHTTKHNTSGVPMALRAMPQAVVDRLHESPPGERSEP